jgi:hypothetical protein
MTIVTTTISSTRSAGMRKTVEVAWSWPSSALKYLQGRAGAPGTRKRASEISERFAPTLQLFQTLRGKLEAGARPRPSGTYRPGASPSVMTAAITVILRVNAAGVCSLW